jgi:hypothetical protein
MLIQTSDNKMGVTLTRRMEDEKFLQKFSRQTFRIFKHKRKLHIKINFKIRGCEIGGWIRLDQDCTQLLALMK